jgi:hypothetical protein
MLEEGGGVLLVSHGYSLVALASVFGLMEAEFCLF